MDDIHLVDYDPAWPERYAEEAASVRAALDPTLILAMEHIGSTAIPGLCAKPVIDILIIVRSLAQARTACCPPLAALGYLFWADNPKQDRLFFVKGLAPQGRGRSHHLHLAEPATEPTRSIAFRDHLRAHPAAAARYRDLKQRLAIDFRHDREGYTAAKSGFIQEILRRDFGATPS